MFNLYVFTIIANYCLAVKFFSAVVTLSHIPPQWLEHCVTRDKGWRMFR
jgi:hypothetical protein